MSACSISSPYKTEVLNCQALLSVTLGQHHTAILPQDQIRKAQNIYVDPDTQVTREGEAREKMEMMAWIPTEGKAEEA